MSGFPPRDPSAKCTRSEAAGIQIAAVRAGSDGFGLFGLFNLYKMTRGGFAAAQRVSTVYHVPAELQPLWGARC